MKELKRILIIEDSEEVIEAVSVAIQIRWPHIDIISTGKGEEGIELLTKKCPDIIILDLGLIDISGFEVLKRIRLFSKIPIIILSVRDEETDIVRGLELGADEYIIKPYRQMELVSRISAITRRVYALENQPPMAFGEFIFDPINRRISSGKKLSPLTQTENNIMFIFAQNPNVVMTHSKIAEAIWGSSYAEVTNSIKVYIRRLRKKIERNPTSPKLIVNRPNQGYVFIPPS